MNLATILGIGWRPQKLYEEKMEKPISPMRCNILMLIN
jgi:hypothetical protein